MSRETLIINPGLGSFHGTTSARERGTSLIEVLVALVVLCVGLLGLAAVQTVAVRYGNQSSQRSQAVILADEIADRMRANASAALAGNYTWPTGGGAPTSSPPSLLANCLTTACAPNQQAVYDLNQWILNDVSSVSPGTGVLAGGAVSVAPNTNAGVPANVYTIVVQWTDPTVNATTVAAVSSVTTNVQLP
ncbi:MAG: type IV pilus modification protein PilV [Sulfuricaulis sp.]